MTNRWLAFLSPAPKRTSGPRPGSPTLITLDLGDRTLQLTVRRNARARRLTLRLTPGGDGAVVTIPKRSSLAEARAFVDRNRGWLLDRLAPETPAGGLIAGALVPVRGVPHVIRPSGAFRGSVRAATDPNGTAALTVPGAPEHLTRRVTDHLKGIARADLTAAVARHAATLGVRPTAIRLKDTTSRWGSASAAGTLSFSWRLAMAPPFVLDYLAAHEVAHLREMNHSDRFWEICLRLAPRSEEARAWLKANGRDLHRIGG